MAPTPAPDDFGVTLECTAEASGSALTLRYSLKNHTGERYVVFNRLAHERSVNHLPVKEHDSNLVQIDYDGSNLVLSKQIPAIPVLWHMHDIVPDQTLLEARSEFSEEFTMPLPAVVNNYIRLGWFDHGKSWNFELTGLRRTKRVRLSIGVFKIGPDERFWDGGSRRPKGIHSVENEATAQYEQVLLSKMIVLPHAIDVLDFEEKKNPTLDFPRE